jgi:protein-tyrosine phosphatase
MFKCISNWIKNNYGSKRGLLNAFKYQCMYYLGFYKKQQNIDWTKVNRLVFLCHGNICRSPLGEYYAKSLGAVTCSCGLACQNGFDADPRAIEYGQRKGLDMSCHKTTNISQMDFSQHDLIIAMDPMHIRELEKIDTCLAQSTLAGLWLKRPQPYIHDPFSVNSKYFSYCESLVISATGGIVELSRRK